MTGASGFLGTHVLAALRKTSANVTGVSRSDGFDVMISSYGDLRPQPNSILVHLAEGPMVNSPDVGNALTDILLQEWRHVIYASSAAVYGYGNDEPHSEDKTPEPDTGYGRTKLANEARVLDRGGTVLRLANLIGTPVNPQTLLGVIIRQLDQMGPLELRARLPERDYLAVADAAQAVAAAIALRPGGVFNIASGHSLAAEKLAQYALDLTGQTDRQITGPEGSRSVLRLSTEKAARELAWRATIPLADCLKAAIDDERNN